MSAKKRRSKRLSVANSDQSPEIRTLYLDRNFGKHLIADALRAASCAVEVHDDHLSIDAPDEHWIELVTKNGWIAITKDKNIRYRHAEIESVKASGARVVVRAKNVTGSGLAILLIKHYQRIQDFACKNKTTFVVGLDRNGKLSLYLV